METKIMQQIEKKIDASLKKGVNAGREIAKHINTLFANWEETDEYHLPAEWLADRFGFSKQYVYKLQQVAERYLDDESFNDLSVTVLTEALPVSNDEAKEYLSECEEAGIRVSSKGMREYVKRVKSIESAAEDMLEDKSSDEPEETEGNSQSNIEILVNALVSAIEACGLDVVKDAIDMTLSKYE